ncbi:MAG: GIY-YIG nuclease family protein [candidate division WOR-3 bacterium]
MFKRYYIYILTNKNNSVLYTGVTNNLKKRIYEHKEKAVSGFTKRYKINKLVYYEIFFDILSALTREKQIKEGSRENKIKTKNGAICIMSCEIASLRSQRLNLTVIARPRSGRGNLAYAPYRHCETTK